MLLIVLGLGEYFTTIYDSIHGSFEYRTTVGPWVRGLFVLHPNPAHMLNVPMMLKIHVVSAFILFASVPFTRLVHFYSLPWRYPTRAPIQFRSRTRYRKVN